MPYYEPVKTKKTTSLRINNYDDIFSSVSSKKEQEKMFKKDNLILLFLRIIVLLVTPVIGTARFFLPPIVLEYGNAKLTTNSLLLLFFGALALVVSAIYFVLVYRIWALGVKKTEFSKRYSWKKMLRSAFLFSIFLGFILAFLSVFTTIPQSNIQKGINGKTFIETELVNAVELDKFVSIGLTFILPTYLFSLGLVLIVIGFKSLRFEKERPILFLRIIFLSSLLFLLIGIVPTIFTAIYWIEGGV